MQKKPLYITAGIIIILGAGLYYSRHSINEWIYEMNRPELPPAIAYQAVATGTGQYASAPPSPVEGGLSASENFVLESSPQSAAAPKDPLAGESLIPPKVNLDVPWMSQAPHANWDMPYQEACEEASMLMVDAFYEQSKQITPDDANDMITKLVDWEVKKYGDYRDQTAEQAAAIMKDYFGYKDVRVLPFKTSEDIKGIVGRGYPVIIPFSGKDLKNPNFRNGGPLYHMLVVKGYTEDGLFITGDPGTRKGRDYTYTYERIIEAAHDWNGGDVANGAKLMIVALPN